MRILLCNTYFFPAVGGIENYLLNIGRIYISKGYSVTVLTLRFDQALKPDELHEGMRIVRFSLRKRALHARFFEPFYWLSSFTNAAVELISQEKFDGYITRDVFSLNALHKALRNRQNIVYVQATAFPLYIKQSLKNKGISVIAKIYWYCYTFFWSVILGLIERNCILRTPQISVLSKSKLTEITAFYRIKKQRYKVIPPGVNTAIFFPSKDETERILIRQKLGLRSDCVIFLYVGRFEKEKNPEAILEAGRNSDSNVHFVFIGNYTDDFRELVKKYSLNEKVTLTGSINEPAEYFCCCDVFVLPSRTEGFGQVILEAMASGLPVIAFKNPKNKQLLANEEIIIHNETGILVDYNDNSRLAEAINLLSVDHGLRSRLGQNAYKLQRQRYSWTNTAESLLKLL